MRQNLTPIDVIGGWMNGNTLLRQHQYDAFSTNNQTSWMLAQHITWNKLYNQEMLLRKIRRQDEVLKDTSDRIHSYNLQTVWNIDKESLLGIEWNAARYFFKEFFREMDWMGRFPRTKRDINNTLLDMGYTFLFHFIEWLLLLYGFDLYEGFYHKRFYERKSLVCDIVEPFRCIIDLSIRKAYNLGQIDKKDFIESNGGYSIKPAQIQKYSRIFSRAILEHREEMYLFVRWFYRHMLAPTDHPFPKFLL
jgi:CRISPR-associated protein Cas1